MSGEEFDVNDIALLVLERALNCSERLTPALFPWKELVVQNVSNFNFPEHRQLSLFTDCYVAGWGKTSYNGKANFNKQPHGIHAVYNNPYLPGLNFAGQYPDRMHEASVDLITKYNCADSSFYGEKIQPGMICAGDTMGGWKSDSCTVSIQVN